MNLSFNDGPNCIKQNAVVLYCWGAASLWLLCLKLWRLFNDIWSYMFKEHFNLTMKNTTWTAIYIPKKDFSRNIWRAKVNVTADQVSIVNYLSTVHKAISYDTYSLYRGSVIIMVESKGQSSHIRNKWKVSHKTFQHLLLDVCVGVRSVAWVLRHIMSICAGRQPYDGCVHVGIWYSRIKVT